MRGFARGVMLVLCLATPGWAEAPATSLRPHLRPASAINSATGQMLATAMPNIRPRPRPSAPAETLPPLGDERAFIPVQAMMFMAPTRLAPVMHVQAAGLRPRARPAAGAPVTTPAPDLVVTNAVDIVSVPRPHARPSFGLGDTTAPERIENAAAVRILPGRSAVIGRKGSVCGDPAIKGEVLAPITSRVHGCGIADPVRVSSTAGVALNPSAVLDCDTARALKDWVATGLKPAFGRKEVASLRIAGSYACRTRDNIKGAPISEHGRGKAIDVAAIVLADGTNITVAKDWRRSAGKPMKAAYHAACGTFGTTLSPDADRYHQDHMHFDTAHQRGGAYCR